MWLMFQRVAYSTKAGRKNIWGPSTRSWLREISLTYDVCSCFFLAVAFLQGGLFCFFSLLASWLLGFSASWLLGFLAFCWFMRLLVALAFRILCIPSASLAGGVLAFAAFRWFMRLLAASAFRILCFPSSSPGVLAFAPFHWFLDWLPASSASPVFSLFESSLDRTAPPHSPATLRLFAE